MSELLDNSLIAEDSGDDDAMTAADVLKKIEELWINEKMSPTLEASHEELIDCMLDQISQMSENLKKCKKTDFRLPIHKLEIDRIRYVICSYLRTRLRKIELYAHSLLDLHQQRTELQSALLSHDEIKFAKEYISNQDGLFDSLALQHMPDNLRSVEKPNRSLKPNVEAYVFFRVNRAVDALLVQDNTGEGRDEEVDLCVGEQHLMPYHSIRHLLQQQNISLI